MTNYSKGYTFEYQTIRQLREDPDVLLAERFHKSVGPFWKKDYDRMETRGGVKNQDWAPKHAPIDIWWLAKDGMHFAQNKKGYKITTEEMLDLILFAWEMEGSAKVHLITKINRKVHSWEISNSTVS